MAITQERAVKVNLTMSPEALEEVERMAKRRNTTIQGLIKDALQLESWYDRNNQDGSKVILKKKDGRMYELERKA